MVHTWKHITCLFCAGNKFFLFVCLFPVLYGVASLWSHVHLVSTETENSEYVETVNFIVFDGKTRVTCYSILTVVLFAVNRGAVTTVVYCNQKIIAPKESLLHLKES